MPNISDWQTFVTEITKRYQGRIKYWELWNEPNVNLFFQGTANDQVTMAAAAYPIIKQSGGTVVSPSASDRWSYQWLDSYLAAGGDSYTDIVAFHGYISGGPPELIVTLAKNVKDVAAKYSKLNGKPIWDTEHSWGTPSWPFGATQDQQAAWLARFLPLSFTSGIQRSMWYKWDDSDGDGGWGPLYNSTTKSLRKAGTAYIEVYNWMIGADMEACTLNGTIYQCPLTRSGGYTGLIVWDASDNPSHTTSYSVPANFVHYRTLDGNTVNIPTNGTLTLGMTPILLEQ